MRSVAIVGGGLSGLALAFRAASAGLDVVVVESSNRLGGQLSTERTDGFVVEHGAEGFVAGSAAVARLAEELGIAGDIIGQSVHDSCAFDGRQLVPLARGEAGRRLGFQVSQRAFGKGIQSFRHGMAQLYEALESALEQLGVPREKAFGVGSLERIDGGFRLHGGPREVRAERVAVAVPAAAAAELLAPTFGALARCLSQSRCTSNVGVNLAFDARDAPLRPNTTGFVVAEGAELAQTLGFRACSYSSAKFAGRSPPGKVLLRTFFRPSDSDLQGLDDDAWIARAMECLSSVQSIGGPPLHGWVARWGHALPVFDDSHRSRVAELERALHGAGVALVGAAFHGSGIDGALRSTESATAALLP